MDYRTFEQRVLDVLFTTTVPLTPAHMAWVVRIPVVEAEKHLEEMVEHQILVKDCDLETGHVSYVFPRRALLAPRDLMPTTLPSRPLYSPAAAALLSVLLPGAGHFYSGRNRAGVGWMIATFMGYLCLVVPGLILHILCIASAANVPRG